jgi:hypothetical protein
MNNNTYTGLNIQWPISELILEGKKVVETRTYPIPEKYIGKELVLIETPGKLGKFKARMTAIIKVTRCFKYRDKDDFYLDIDRHMVTPESIWAWDDDKPKYGWELEVLKIFSSKIPFQKQKGIVFTKDIQI